VEAKLNVLAKDQVNKYGPKTSYISFSFRINQLIKMRDIRAVFFSKKMVLKKLVDIKNSLKNTLGLFLN
jgi:hypothetical protein